MKKTIWFGRFLALAAVCAWLTGCVTVHSTIESRKQEYYAAYQALTPELKSAVDAGQVKAGMNTDAVYIAWGRPTRMLASGNQSGETTTWIYEGAYLSQYNYFGYYRVHYGYTTVPYTRAKVVFANGLVKEWERYVQP